MPTSIYVHVPFCVSRCGYCNFYSGEPLSSMDGYPALILAEAKLRRPAVPDPGAATLYIGGGTPSLLGVGRLAELVVGLSRVFPLKPGAEITVEVNPSSSLDFNALADGGVNRVSVGVQAVSDDHLARLGRPHSAAEALQTLQSAAKAGLSVSADLIFGYAGLTVADLLAAADGVIDAGASHLSAYSLEIGPGCRVERAEEAEEEAQEEALSAHLEKRGFTRYEVSNYALPGKESRHNTGYWEGWGYMGLGPGAHGFLPHAGENGERYANLPNLAEWKRVLEAGSLPPHQSEWPTDSEAALEKLFLALRRTAPFNAGAISSSPEFLTEIERLATAGDLTSPAPLHFAVTQKGLRRADGLAMHLHSVLFP